MKRVIWLALLAAALSSAHARPRARTAQIRIPTTSNFNGQAPAKQLQGVKRPSACLSKTRSLVDAGAICETAV
jgi:hypothetical protein